jgi:Tol biopolymer transport system component
VREGRHIAGPWSPNSRRESSSLIYAGGSIGHSVIWTVPVAGGESTLLIGPRGNWREAENGSQSPDGSLVTFLGSQIGGPKTLRW